MPGLPSDQEFLNLDGGSQLRVLHDTYLYMRGLHGELEEGKNREIKGKNKEIDRLDRNLHVAKATNDRLTNENTKLKTEKEAAITTVASRDAEIMNLRRQLAAAEASVRTGSTAIPVEVPASNSVSTGLQCHGCSQVAKKGCSRQRCGKCCGCPANANRRHPRK